MFGKLLKHEYRAAGRILLPLYGALLLLTGIGLLARAAAGAIPRWQESVGSGVPAASVLFALSVFLSILGLAALLLTTVIFFAVRFYRMLGDEGYLAFSLPVTPAQHIGAKLVAAVTWTLFSLLTGGSCLLLLSLPGAGPEADAALRQVPAAAWAVAAGILWLMLCAACAGYLTLFLCCAVGAQWRGSRLIATVASYVALSVLLQIAGLVLLLVTGLLGVPQALYSWYLQASAAYGSAVLVQLPIYFCLGSSALLLAFCAAAFFLIRWLLSKRLNLA